MGVGVPSGVMGCVVRCARAAVTRRRARPMASGGPGRDRDGLRCGSSGSRWARRSPTRCRGSRYRPRSCPCSRRRRSRGPVAWPGVLGGAGDSAVPEGRGLLAGLVDEAAAQPARDAPDPGRDGEEGAGTAPGERAGLLQEAAGVALVEPRAASPARRATSSTRPRPCRPGRRRRPSELELVGELAQPARRRGSAAATAWSVRSERVLAPRAGAPGPWPRG